MPLGTGLYNAFYPSFTRNRVKKIIFGSAIFAFGGASRSSDCLRLNHYKNHLSELEFKGNIQDFQTASCKNLYNVMLFASMITSFSCFKNS